MNYLRTGMVVASQGIQVASVSQKKLREESAIFDERSKVRKLRNSDGVLREDRVDLMVFNENSKIFIFG